MRILGVCGSPRKGNSYRVLQNLKENYPDVDLEILHLNDRDFRQCRGCYSCVLAGEDKCPIKDERENIINEILKAHGVVFASPVYCLQVSSVMKNFMDRLGYNAHRPIFYDKFAMTAVTCSGYGGQKVNAYMKSIFSSFGFNVVSSVDLRFLPGGLKEEDVERNGEKMRAGFNILLERIKSGRRDKPSISLLVPFLLFKEVSKLKKDVMTADYEYYKDKGGYCYDTKVPFLKRMIAENVVRKILKSG